MSVLLFLNELSCAEPTKKELANDAMRQFVLLLMRIKSLRSDAVLVSNVKRDDLELAPGYYLREWAGQAAHIDLWRSMRRMQDRAPFSDVLPPGVGDGIEYRLGEQAAEAVAAAHLMDGLLVSLLLNKCWDVPWLNASRSVLTDDAGHFSITDDEVQIRHAATLDHVAAHEEWIKQIGVLDLASGTEIWEQRAAIFPNLQFLPRVERLLRELREDWVTSLAWELRRIDGAIADWDPAVRSVPTWRSQITPEHEQRKRLCRFTDLDGETRVFDLHGRFHPGAGRVHFRLVHEERKARIAYVGLKLGI